MSDELAKFLMDTANAWNIDNKISTVVRDNISNIVGAVRKNNWRHVPFFAHVLNIGIQRLGTFENCHYEKKKNILFNF